MQTYENYWKLTLEYTDIWNSNFCMVLKTIIDFIDEHISEPYSPKKYLALQEEVESIASMTSMPSVRKAINQTVKLGFVNTHLESYHAEAKNFLAAQTEKKKRTIFSKILYSNASFNRSVNNECRGLELNFLIKTLIEVGRLSRTDIMAMMTINVATYPQDFLNREQLNDAIKHANSIDFIKRKYNQVGYMWNILGKLDNLSFVDNYLYFSEDAERIFGDDYDTKETRKRDSYLQRLYKNQLASETETIFGGIKCMVEQISYPVLIASHIKPFIDCTTDEEAYNANNGFLLSKNIDSLFDLGYITFDDYGCIITSEDLKEDVIQKVQDYKVDARFINAERIEFLKYHRKYVFKKRYASASA